MEIPESDSEKGVERPINLTMNISPRNMDDNPTDYKIFYTLVVILEIFGLAAFILVLLWTQKYLGGFAWGDGSSQMFNYHPVFMVIGMILLSGNSLIAYRVLRHQEKFTVKLIHCGLHMGTFVFTVLSLIAVFEFHNKNSIPNMYTLHSWIGLLAVTFYAAQLALGFLGFLFPKFNEDTKRAYLTVHVFFGVVIFTLAIVAAISGITEKMIFAFKKTYPEFPPVGIVANLLGMTILVFGGLVFYLVYHPAYKRVDKYEHLE